MSFNRPQTLSVALAILTLFAPAAWGQQKEDAPVYKSNNAIFDANSLVDKDGFLKSPLSELRQRQQQSDPIEESAVAKALAAAKGTDSTQEKPSIIRDKDRIPAKNAAHEKIDSLFGTSSTSFVNKDGYFLPASGQGLWSDAKPSPRNSTQSPDGQQVSNAASQQPTRPTFPGPSKLRLRIGFDALFFERGRAEDTIFATDDNGQQFSFSDFQFTDGTARYFIQFMGDDDSGFEFTFFDFNSFSGSLDATGPNVVPFFFQAVPATSSASFDLNYSSRLKNIEFNSWVRHNPLQRSGYGIRHINLDESFEVIGGGSLSSRTDNDLWGLTKMWERRRPLFGGITLTGGLDAGLYINDVQIDVDTLNVDDSSEQRNVAGTLGFNLGLQYQAASNVSFRCGYEGLGIFGVGLASTQSLEQNLLSGLDDAELGSIYFGGFYIGALATF